MQPDRSERRHRGSAAEDQRLEFQKDRDRLLYSDALRRLQGVTQVVSADEGWVFHNRLTHSLKVAQVARRIAEHLQDSSDADCIEELGGLSPDVAEAAGLGHDLGHPPFGHVAEETLDELVEEGFEGNAQSFRIITRLEPHRSGYRGLNLTRACLLGILKYPRARTEKGDKLNSKYGYYRESERRDFEFARQGEPRGAPSRSLEAEIMDFADDITFAVHDTEDFYRAGMIPLPSLRDRRGVEWGRLVANIQSRWDSQGREVEDWAEHEAALEDVLALLSGVAASELGSRDDRAALKQATSGLIGHFVMNGLSLRGDRQPGQSRVQKDEKIELQIKMLKELVWTYVIDRPSLATQQAGHRSVIKALFEHFEGAVSRRDFSLIPLQFHELVQERDPGPEPDRRLAADMVCSLTDRQALVLFRRITGFDPGTMGVLGL